MKRKDEEEDEAITEEYIEKVIEGLDGLSPEDFDDLEVKIPTDAEDGETVAMILTGTAKNGFLEDVYGSEVDLNDDEPEYKGRIKSAIKSGDESED